VATARRTGTNEAISTFGGATRGTTTISTWEIGTDITLTSGIDKVTVASVSGPFEPGEPLSFATSGATATFIGLSADSTTMYYVILTGNPAATETITGDNSTETASLTAEVSQGGVSPVLEFYDDAASFDQNIDMADAACDANSFRICRPASGQGHDGTSNNGVFLDSTDDADAAIIRTSGGETFSQLQDIIIKNTNPSSGSNWGVRLHGDDSKAIGMIVFDCSSTSGSAYGYRNPETGSTMIDCLANNCENHNITGAQSGETSYCYNCTSHESGGRGFDADGGTNVLKNCIFTGSTGGDDIDTGGTYTGSVTNASEDGSAATLSIGVDITETDFTKVYVSPSGNDFHLKTDATTQVRNAGTDLSGDSVFAFDDDIDGDIFVSPDDWDIGFDEPEAAGVGVVPRRMLMGVGV